ncbi:MAG TPA: GNAT family protein [Puia sp.]|nr:GNAT family protein [Puia sp.]
MEKQSTLRGKYIYLEPMEKHHAAGLAAASAPDPSLYKWSPVPQGIEEVTKYIQTGIDLRESGSALPFVIIRVEDGTIIGSTRFWNMERWAWQPGHERYGRVNPDACEIGYTWLTRSSIRTAANTEAKLLLLELAFEKWKVFRVCLHADSRNSRSCAAIERIGAKLEGILRAHRLAVDNIPRDSARYSIIASEWPEVKIHLVNLCRKYNV